MAKTNSLKNLVIFFVVLLNISITMANDTVNNDNDNEDDNLLTLRDLNAAIFTLRSNGFNLFANSIAVSDISFQILSLSSSSSSSSSSSVDDHQGYTFLAPPNSVLFSLDMSTDAFTYVHSLRFHVIPRRLSYDDLRNVSVSSRPYLETLAGGGDIIAVASSGDVVSVDGVLVSFPDMFLHPKIAVHGIDGILSSSADDLGFVFAPQPFAGEFSSATSPEVGAPSPVTSFASFTIGSEFGSVSIPPSEFYSSDFAETPVTSPSPSPECNKFSDCDLDFVESLSPSPECIDCDVDTLWPPISSVMLSATVIPSSSSSETPLPPIITGDDDESEEAGEMRKREGEEGKENDDSYVSDYVIEWRVEHTENHDYDRLNFAKYNQHLNLL